MTVLRGHSRCVRRIAALPKSNALATASDDGGVRIYALNSDGRPLHALRCHDHRAQGLAELCTDVLLSVGQDGMIKTWNVRTGEQLGEASLESDRRGCTLARALDGRSFVVGTNRGDLIFYDHDRGLNVREIARRRRAHADRINDIDVDSVANEMLTASNDGKAHVWSMTPWRPIGTLHHRDRVFCAHIGRAFILTGGTNEIFLFRRGGEFPPFTTVRVGPGVVWSIHTMADDSLAMTAGDNVLSFTCLATGRCVEVVPTSSKHVLSTDVLPNGAVAYCGSGQNSAGFVCMPSTVAEAVQVYADKKNGVLRTVTSAPHVPPPPPVEVPPPPPPMLAGPPTPPSPAGSVTPSSPPATQSRDPRLRAASARSDPHYRDKSRQYAKEEREQGDSRSRDREWYPKIERVRDTRSQQASQPTGRSRSTSSRSNEQAENYTRRQSRFSAQPPKSAGYPSGEANEQSPEASTSLEWARVKKSGASNSASSVTDEDAAVRVMRDWSAKGVSASVVRVLEAPELASMMASFMLRYRETWKSKFDGLRSCLHTFFDDNFLTGEDIVGKERVKTEDLYEGIIGALEKDSSIGAKMGLKNGVLRLLETLRADSK